MAVVRSVGHLPAAQRPPNFLMNNIETSGATVRLLVAFSSEGSLSALQKNSLRFPNPYLHTKLNRCSIEAKKSVKCGGSHLLVVCLRRATKITK